MLIARVIDRARARLDVLGIDATVGEAARRLGVAGTDMLVVARADGRLAGVLTKTDLVRGLYRGLGPGQGSGAGAGAAAVRGAMSATVATVRSDGWLAEAWATMRARGFKNLPVLDRTDRPIGLLNARDALEALLSEATDEEQLLKEYVGCVGYH